MDETNKDLEFSDISETLDITKHITIAEKSNDATENSEPKELKPRRSRRVASLKSKSTTPQLSIFDSLSRAGSKSPTKSRGVGKESFMDKFIKTKSDTIDDTSVMENSNSDDDTITKKTPKRQSNKRKSRSVDDEVDDDYHDEFLVSDIALDNDDDDDDFVLNEADANLDDNDDEDDLKDKEINEESEDLTSDLKDFEILHEADEDIEELPKKRRKTGKSNTTPKKRATESKKRATESKKSSPKKASQKVSKKTPISSLSSKIVRGFKDLTSAKDKIMRMYGIDRDKLLPIAKVKEGFESYLFDFPRDNIQPESLYYVNHLPPCATSNVYEELLKDKNTEYQTITEEELNQLFKYRSDHLDIIVGQSEYNMNSNEKVELPIFENYKRDGLIYNCGGLVTDMEWLTKVDENNENDEVQYLALSLSQYIDNPTAPELEMFGKETHGSCIEVFEMNKSTGTFQKIQTIVHSFGETWNLKWHEGCQNDKNIGVLSFVAQDGSVKLIEINKEKTNSLTIKHLLKPSISVLLNNIKITCFDFLSPKTIICGLNNGYVAEFDLSDDENMCYPSIYEKISDSYVASIIATYSEFEELTVNTVSTDGYFQTFNPKDIFSTKLTGVRFRGYNRYPMTYIPQLYFTVFTDGCNALRALHDRASFLVHSVGAKDSTITSLGSSRLHPLLLSGTSDGEVCIDNMARRALHGVKDVIKIHKSLKLWKWDHNLQTKQYRLDHNYEVIKINTNDVAKTKIDFHGISISVTKWNQTSSMGKTFAFANNAGLLTIETLSLEN